MADSLQEQMLKLGLVDEKQIRDAEAKKRNERRPKGQGKRTGGRGGRERGPSQKSRALQAARKAARERLAANESVSPEVEAKIQAVVKAGRRKGQIDGRRRFYFDSRDGRVPYLDLNEDVIGELETGAVALVESPAGQTSIITAEAAEEIMALDVDWLRRWNA